MLHRLCGPPSIPLSFTLASVLPRWNTYQVSFGTDPYGPTPSIHRLGRGLPGYLILFATHAFVPQRQFWLSELPTQSGFLVVSMHFTATPPVPPALTKLKPASINGSSRVEPWDFTADLTGRLRTL